MPTTAWYLNDLGELRGKQELYTLQSPQRMKALRESAVIESALSSNRIEGGQIDPKRVRDVLVAPHPLFRDRDEEVRGYRDALALIHHQADQLTIDNTTILRQHALARGEIWDAGQYKSKDNDIIERYPDGSERVRFKTVTAADTQAAMAALIADWAKCLEERWVPPLLALAAFNLDFLCIHPFRDGNGRVSRLLWLLQSYQLGYEVGCYISQERLVDENKERYYETLEQSSQGWCEGEHAPWPFINYVLSIMKTAYRDFIERVAEIIPVLLVFGGLLWLYPRFRFSNTAYLLMAVWLFWHGIGAHYTFAEVPFDWFNGMFGSERNQFDRIAHF